MADRDMLSAARRTVARALNHERNQWSYNRQRIAGAGHPAVFQIELTNHCPMRCEMCPRTHRMQRPLGYMSWEVYERIIDQACDTTSKVFLHHFGDSLMHPEIGNYIAYARAHGIRTYLSANPILLTPDRISALVESELDELVLSLDGVTSETSSSVRGLAAANIDLAEERVQQLLQHRAQARATKPYVIMQIVRQKQNVHEVDAWLHKWRAMEGVDRVKVKTFISWDGRDDAIERLRPEPRPERVSVVCDKPWTSVTVLWDGTVVPCCFDFDGILALGNLATEALDDIWRGERARDLRRAHRDGDLQCVTLCAKCKDKEGYPVRKWYYPVNRLAQGLNPLGHEWGDDGSVGS